MNITNELIVLVCKLESAVFERLSVCLYSVMYLFIYLSNILL